MAIPVVVQLGHAGRKAASRAPWLGGQQIPLSEGGWPGLAPSAVAIKDGEVAPMALDQQGKRLLVAVTYAGHQGLISRFVGHQWAGVQGVPVCPPICPLCCIIWVFIC